MADSDDDYDDDVGLESDFDALVSVSSLPSRNWCVHTWRKTSVISADRFTFNYKLSRWCPRRLIIPSWVGSVPAASDVRCQSAMLAGSLCFLVKLCKCH